MDSTELTREALDAIEIDAKYLRSRNCLEHRKINDAEMKVAKHIVSVSEQLVNLLKKAVTGENANSDTDND